MSATILHFPNQALRGTIHVMPHQHGGFEVGQESASGNSWGSFEGPFDTIEIATAAAHALNILQYGGVCEISVFDEPMDGAA